MTRSAIEQLAKKDAEAQREAIQYLVQKSKLPRKKGDGKAKVVLPRKKKELVTALIKLWGVREGERFLKLFATSLEEAKARPSAAAEQSGKRSGHKTKMDG